MTEKTCMDAEESTVAVVQQQLVRRPRFSSWAGHGLPKGWAVNMGFKGEAVGDVVWPIVDNEAGHVIDGYPTPEQALCWCPSAKAQDKVIKMLREAAGVDPNEGWF